MINEEDFKTKEVTLVIIIAISLVLSYFVFTNDLFSNKNISESPLPACGDGTAYNTCSKTKPYFCENGILIEKSSVCGCDENMSKNLESCTFGYKAYPQDVTLRYMLDGKEKDLNFTVYGDMADYLSKVPRTIDYLGSEKPLRADFKLKTINEQNQRELLLPLVVEIQNLANNKADQARIAVSIVQNIPYNSTERKISFAGGEVNYSKYPYEVLYYNQGICGEKSALLAFLLKEIGYNVSIFYFAEENHEVVGIACPVEKSFKHTGYCFVETGGPAIISDSSLIYAGGIKLKSEPEIMFISEGVSLPESMQEYSDARTMKNIRNGNLFGVFESWKFSGLKEKYGLNEEYNLL